MKLKRILAILAIAATVGLFAEGMKKTDAVTGQINKTTEAKEKSVLMKKSDAELKVKDKKDLPKVKKTIEPKIKK